MHMADALLSPAVGGAMCAVSAAANAYAVKKIKKDDLCEKKIPVMGVMGAFVFAAQMINFTIPATGSSGHIGGGILLAAMIGGFPALLSISAVLIIQCLFFADGGLLALGCNIFNMGVIPCLIVCPLVFKPLLKNGRQWGRIAAASILAVVVSLQLGAFGVVLETRLSGITALPFGTFLFLMQPIHLAIGVAEGIITAAVLCFVYKIRPEIMESTFDGAAIQNGVPMRNVLIVLAVVTLLVGGALSLFASSYPDGLEWAVGKTAGVEELEADGAVFKGAASLQEATALMPDYDFKDAGEDGSGIGTTVAGMVGGVLTFVLAGAAAFGISTFKKKRKGASPA
ncbi:MAG: energy-coupling factor ABC transporter permease [Oscillospiraceae bacterium]|jgi:cobalt/nickel transport system permease protein|nr:energy-coupling factor ABC transporter permease [Oscillospiraceae bacterium]